MSKNIKRKDVNGNQIIVPKNATVVPKIDISTDIKVSDLLNQSKYIAFSELTKLQSIALERKLAQEEVWQLRQVVAVLVDLQKIEKNEVKDFNLDSMETEQLLRLVQEHIDSKKEIEISKKLKKG